MDLHTLNENYIPSSSIGLQIILGLHGFPTNRILLAYGTPHSGKSTLFFHIAATLDKSNMLAAKEKNGNGDEPLLPHRIVLIETEGKIDTHYFGTFFAHRTQNLLENGASQTEVDLLVLQHHHKNHRQMIRQIEAIHKARKFNLTYCSPLQLQAEKAKLAKLEALIKLIKAKEYPYPPAEIILENDAQKRPTIQHAAKLLRDARTDFHLQDVHLYQHIHTLDDLETFIFQKFVEPARKNPELRKQHTLLIIDTLSELAPKAEYEKTISTEGNAFGNAAYLSRWAPKLPTYILEANLTIAIVVQQTTNLTRAMNRFAPSDPVLDPAFKGGNKMRYLATIMVEIKRQKAATTVNGQVVGAAQIKLPKDSLIRGAQASRQGTFYIIPGSSSTDLDFDEPFFNDWCASAPQTDPQTGVFVNRNHLGIPFRFIQEQIDALQENIRTEVLKNVKPLKEHIKLKGLPNNNEEDPSETDNEPNNHLSGSLLEELAKLSDNFASPGDDSEDAQAPKKKTPTQPVGWDPETPYLYGAMEAFLPFVIQAPYIRQSLLDARQISTNNY